MNETLISLSYTSVLPQLIFTLPNSDNIPSHLVLSSRVEPKRLTMDEQQVSVVLLAINNVKEVMDDMRKSVDDLRMNLKEMRKALNTTTALLKYFGNSEKEVLTEDDDVTSSKVVVVGWNGARSCEPCALNSSFKACLPTVCENDSVRLPSVFVTELTFGEAGGITRHL